MLLRQRRLPRRVAAAKCLPPSALRRKGRVEDSAWGVGGQQKGGVKQQNGKVRRLADKGVHNILEHAFG
jgi:hypothetical protein